MDKQTSNIKLLKNGNIRFKTGRIEKPYNRVHSLASDCVELVINDKYITTIDTEDYFNYSLWANHLYMEHTDIHRGVIVVDTGYTHKSVPALLMQTEKGQRVGYLDGNCFNLRKSNLYIISAPDYAE